MLEAAAADRAAEEWYAANWDGDPALPAEHAALYALAA